MISRIMLRRVLGREPTGDEVDDQMKKLDKKAVPRPSVDDIVAALESGEEVPPARSLLSYLGH